jgi:molybdate transport system ATP-binding protein
MLVASVHKRRPSGFALAADLRVPGGITIVFGASGSGKTTLLRCLAGLEKPDAGRVQVGHAVLFDAAAGIDRPPQQRHVGFVLQHLALFPHLTVADNIEYGLGRLDRGERRTRSEAIARSFRIDGLLHRKPSQISGGERQRSALARSLVTDPALLLLDEPLSALDYSTQSLIMADLRAWNAAHRIPILYVTHSHREVFALGEHVLVFQDGRIVAEGSPHAVLHAPAQETIAQISGFENIVQALVVALRPDRGTMECRLSDATEIEVPLTRAAAGDRVKIAIRAGDILLASEPPRGLSARNVLPGTIVSLRREGTMSVVVVDASPRFEVHVTISAEESLALAVGRSVWLVIKTHSCHLVAS